MPAPISPIEDIIEELRHGRMVVLVDEEDRENEGDLVLAADFVTPDAINFMAMHGRGLICLTLTAEKCAALNLRPMVSQNGTQYGTNFTASIEAATGVTTGISAADRAHTIRVAVAKDAKASDIVQPGHVFPLTAQEGGVLMRAGHTEAGCDLAQLAGLSPAAVICEILKEDGSMARLPDLQVFAETHGLKIGTIADLIHYRSTKESLIERLGARPMQTPFGPLQGVYYRDKPSGALHMALVHGQPTPEQEVLVRVHEPTTVLDFLEVEQTTHSWPMGRALQTLQTASAGVLILLNCASDSAILQDKVLNLLGQRSPSPPGRTDLRTYGVGAQILRDLGVQKMKLLAKPRKMPSMQGFDLHVTGYIE
jgi:3,4-dihydroxy 2-butanone 4-phosphate synthase/GTP cyclohydrolase II